MPKPAYLVQSIYNHSYYKLRVTALVINCLNETAYKMLTWMTRLTLQYTHVFSVPLLILVHTGLFSSSSFTKGGSKFWWYCCLSGNQSYVVSSRQWLKLVTTTPSSWCGAVSGNSLLPSPSPSSRRHSPSTRRPRGWLGRAERARSCSGALPVALCVQLLSQHCCFNTCGFTTHSFTTH